MRFKAWQGLSDEYRVAVDGHSPWSAEDPAPEPILVADVSTDPSLGELRDTVLAEGIHALAFVPLTAQRRLIGKFMLYYDAPHEFRPDEVQLAQTVANNLALALARRSAEEAVRESELRYRGLIEGVGVAVYTTDAEGRITLYNEAAVELWGRRPEIGKDLWCGSLRLYQADGTPMAHDECPMALTLKEGRPVTAREAVLERPDGTRVPFIPFPTPLFNTDGSLVGAVNVLVDIRDRKRAEDALQAERQRIENIIANVPGIVFEVRGAPGAPDQKIEYVSDYCERMLGYTAEEWKQDPDLWHRIIHPEDRERALEEARQTWAGKGGLTQYRVFAKDGRVLWLEAQSSVVPDAKGKPIGRRGVITDITLRKAADTAREELVSQLQAERARIRAVISDVPGLVWEAYGRPDSAQQRIDFVSDYVEGMTGYKPEEWLGTPNFWLTIVHPEDRERAAAEAAAIFNSGTGGRSEFRWVRKDGRPIWVDAQSTVIKDEGGKPIGMRGVTVDVSARKEAEEALRAAETQLSLVTNAVPALISYVDKNHRYVYNNDAYGEWFGEEPERIKGRHLREVLGAKAYGAVRPYLDAALSGEVTRFEQLVPYRGAGKRWIHAEYIPHRIQGRVEGIVALINDISERKSAEERLRSVNSEVARRLNEETALNRIAELLRTTLDVVTLCQVALTQATSVTGTEFGLMAIREGETARVVCSMGLSEAALEPFETLEAGGSTQLARSAFEGRAAFSPQARILPGSARFLEESSATRFAVAPLIARGAIVGAIEIAGRTGRTWSAEDRAFLRRIADHIALAVSNAQAYQSIEEAYKRRDEGVRALAHEIRTPLTAIKGFSQIALRQVERGATDMERLQDSMQEIASASDRLVRVAEDMLSASSVESGITRLRKERVSLGTFLRDALIEFTAEDRPCPVQRARSPRAYLEIDAQLIRQVLWNLLSNAMKHSPRGEPIRVEAERDRSTVIISVIDRGPGVPEADREHLFEKFYTGSENDNKGLGLGLYVARQVVQAHGGRIWCESAEGGGASFRFSLPIRRVL
jgi:PAS domain S-box-containing protein